MESKAKILVVLVVIVSFGLAACVVSPAAPTPVPPTPTPVPPSPTPVPPTLPPPTPTPSITLGNLTGVWYIANYETYLQLREDGTYGFADTQQLLEEGPFDAGQFRLEGTSLTFITNNESEYCTGQTGSYEVALTGEGKLRFVLQEDPCMERLIGLPTAPWDPIPPTPSIALEDLMGIWRSPGGLYLEFNEDGTFRRAGAAPSLKTAPYEEGQFQLEGTWLTLVSSNDSQACRGQSGRYQVELTGEGQLQFELQEDECQVRGNWQPGTWDQMLPTSAPSSISVEDLTGVWKKDLAGVFLQLNEDGTYAFADTGPAFLEKAPFDIGEFRLEGTSLTFITSDESIFCVGQTGSYQVELTEQGQFHFELKEDACQNRASGIPGPWIRYEP